MPRGLAQGGGGVQLQLTDALFSHTTTDPGLPAQAEWAACGLRVTLPTTYCPDSRKFEFYAAYTRQCTAPQLTQ